MASSMRVNARRLCLYPFYGRSELCDLLLKSCNLAVNAGDIVGNDTMCILDQLGKVVEITLYLLPKLVVPLKI